MKGISNMVILAIFSFVIVAILFLTGSEKTGSIFSDKRAETNIVAMGVRNAIVQVSLTERGVAYYSTPKGEEYAIMVNTSHVTAQYTGSTIPPFKPLVTMLHYTADVTAASLVGNEFCISNKRDSSCNRVISVCLKGTACCDIADVVAC